MRKRFSELTTIGVGGWASNYLVATTTEELIAAVRAADDQGEPLLVIGEGSNLVVGDSGFDGTVVRVQTQPMRLRGDQLAVSAGASWDGVVAWTLDAGLGGLEALSGVPGSAGATPIQNVGAYGSVVADGLTGVTVYDRQTRSVRDISAADCGFGSHRRSIFKGQDRYVVLTVHFRLPRTLLSQPIAYASLAERLGVRLGAVVPAARVRGAVLELRRERGMLHDPADHDTWSVGSFFVNPVVDVVPGAAAGCPVHPDAAGTKLSAGWLIEHAGFPPGYGRQWGRGRVRLSSKHALAVTNRGGATTAEIMSFAGHIRAGVQHAFGVQLHPECDLLNCRISR